MIDDADELFLEEFHSFSKTINKPTKQQLQEYKQKMNFMESVHDEIRSKIPSFMPPYTPLLDVEFTVNKKYMDIVYNAHIPSRNKIENSH